MPIARISGASEAAAEEFGRYSRSEITKWTKIAKDVGATID